MGEKCLKCEQVCVWLFLFLPAALLVPCMSIAGIVLGSISLTVPQYNSIVYFSCFCLLIALSCCACQISLCAVYAKLRESSWRKNKLNQPNTQQQNNLPQHREEDYFAGIMPRTPPPTYTMENERARIIPTYNQAIL